MPIEALVLEEIRGMRGQMGEIQSDVASVKTDVALLTSDSVHLKRDHDRCEEACAGHRTAIVGTIASVEVIAKRNADTFTSANARSTGWTDVLRLGLACLALAGTVTGLILTLKRLNII